MPLPGPRGNLAFSVPPIWPRVSTQFFPAQPTDDLCDSSVQPEERQVLRWYVLSRSPDGISPEEGEQWFNGVHIAQLAASTGAYRIFSTRAFREAVPLPGEWPSANPPPHHIVQPRWDRLTEYWFETFDEWRSWIRRGITTLSAPPWCQREQFRFFRARVGLASTFLLEPPTDEFSRDARRYV